MSIKLIKRKEEQGPAEQAPLSLKAMETRLREEAKQWREQRIEIRLQAQRTLVRL
jgi:hypothetical protein